MDDAWGAYCDKYGINKSDWGDEYYRLHGTFAAAYTAGRKAGLEEASKLFDIDPDSTYRGYTVSDMIDALRRAA